MVGLFLFDHRLGRYSYNYAQVSLVGLAALLATMSIYIKLGMENISIKGGQKWQYVTEKADMLFQRVLSVTP